MEQSESRSDAWSPGKVALATLVVLAVVAGFWILFWFRLVLFSLFAALVLSTAFTPLINRLQRWGISRAVSVILISLVIITTVIVLIITVAPLLIEQWATFSALLSNWYRDLRETLLGSPSLLVRRIVRQLPRVLPLTLLSTQPDPTAEGEVFNVVQQSFTIGSIILRNFLPIIGMGLLTSFWILEGDRAKRFFLLLLPAQRRENVREFMGEVEDKVGAYIRGLVILSGIIGAMAPVSYTIIGPPNALLLAVFAGIMEAIPLIGPKLGALPAVLVAASTDPSKIIWVIIATAVFQALENSLIVPRVMSRAVGINPVASLLASIAFGSIFGFVGALLAIPLAAVIQITLRRFLFRSNPADQNPQSGVTRLAR